MGFSGTNKETRVSTSDVEIPVTLPASINNLDEVVVSAEKKEQLIQELPEALLHFLLKKSTSFDYGTAGI
ncbi:hypothetical protein BH20BAC1_BH20BAC1_25240 [soil metagenome]